MGEVLGPVVGDQRASQSESLLLRSLLFVPAHRTDWAHKAANSGADAVILDLEDSVPGHLKDDARHATASTIQQLATSHPRLSIFVRLNPTDSQMCGVDISATAVDGLCGYVVPKVHGVRDIIRVEALVEHFEAAHSLSSPLNLIPTFETAQAYAECEKIAGASHRILTLFAGTARDADGARSIGFRFTPGGQETLYLRSRALLAARAAGCRFPVVGVWQDVGNLQGLRRFADANRDLGYRGLVVIHPSHVPVANEVFTPSEAEYTYYSAMLEAFAEAEVDGRAAISFDGELVDYAHAETAREVVQLFEAIRNQV